MSPEDREEVFGPAMQIDHDSNIGGDQTVIDQAEATLASVQSPRQQIIESVMTNFDAPACGNCGSIMVRAGSCYSCPNCFATTGVCN